MSCPRIDDLVAHRRAGLTSPYLETPTAAAFHPPPPPLTAPPLQVGYEALHRAGFTLDSLEGSDTGIFVGACGTDWATLLAEGAAGGPPRGPYTRYIPIY